MDKPIIVCVSRDCRAVSETLGPVLDDAYTLEFFASMSEACERLATASSTGADVALKLTDGDSSSPHPMDFQAIPASTPEELRRTVQELLARWELSRLRARNELLELLSDVGVTLAGSFDIQTILQTTHAAASRLVDGSAVDVLYRGCEAINSRPLWYPAQPGTANVTFDEREAIAAGTVEDTRRTCVPIAYQDDVLGLLFLSPPFSVNADSARLLSILSLQAATALRNIHLNQERIHFERLAAIGRMIGSVVHDFRSPLTALRGYAGMLANLELDERERAAYGHDVMEECDRLNHMVGELLEFTRGGSFELTPSWTELGPYLDALAERLRVQFGGQGVRIELHPNYAGEILLDTERMERALWNVATNACQAMPEGGVLAIRTEKQGEGFALSIEDEGTGIPEEVRHRIFEPFFSYGKSEGIGLGMMIARKIVEEHGGDIIVESRESGGTRVRFVLPAGGAEQPSTVTVTAEQSTD